MIPSGYDIGGYGAPDPIGHGRPPAVGGIRCDDSDTYKQMGSRQRMRRQYIRRFSTVQSLIQCQRECAEARDFICRAFNYRYNLYQIKYIFKNNTFAMCLGIMPCLMEIAKGITAN